MRANLNEKAKRFTIDNEFLHECMAAFDGLQEDLSQLQREEKILNDFVCQVPLDFIVLEVRELDVIADKFESTFQKDLTLL
jgi:hypothetical protein